MESIEQVLEWAEDHAEAVTREMKWVVRDSGRIGYWEAVDLQAKGRIQARVASALDFLDRFTGTGSRWSERADSVFTSRHATHSMESGAHAIGDVIMEWIRMVRAGQAKPRRVETLQTRAVSSTDLLEQVRALNQDEQVVPAAPILLAGAALEIALRAAIEEIGRTVDGRRSIDAYAQELRRAEVLNKQDIKDVTQIAGLRNNAAHGEFDLLSRERAGLMEQQVNLFLARLDEAVQQAI